MLPIQFVLLLIMVSLPGEIAMTMVRPAYGQNSTSVGWIFAIIASFLSWHGCVGLYVWLKTKRAIHQLHQPSNSTTDVTTKTDALFSWARWLTLVITAAHLFTPFPWAVFDWLQQTQLMKHV